jgi:hypothetical protein
MANVVSQRVLFCQACGRFQFVVGAVRACESCSGVVFHTWHPIDLHPGWEPRLTPFDERFIAELTADRPPRKR